MKKKYLVGIIALIAMIIIPNSVSADEIKTFDITSKLPLKIGEAKTDIENKANYMISDTMTIERVTLMTRADESSEIPATDTTLDGTKNYALEIIVKVADTVNNTIPDELNESEISTSLLFQGLSRVIEIQTKPDRIGNVAIPLGTEKITRVNSGYDGDQYQARVRVYFKAKNPPVIPATSLIANDLSGNHTLGEGKDYTVDLIGDISLLDKVMIDNNTLNSPTDYSIEPIASGHRLIIKSNYLENLTTTTHLIELKLNGSNPSLVGRLTLERANIVAPTSANNIVNPNTSDGIINYCILLVLSTIIISTGIITLKRKNSF